MKLSPPLAALPGALFGGMIEGTWQGTLIPPNQNREIRIAVKIAKDRTA